MSNVHRELESIVTRLRAAHTAQPYPPLKTRQDRLRRLMRLVLDEKAPLCDAIRRDFGHRSVHDSLMGDIFVTVNHIRYIRNRLGGWMRPRPGWVNWFFLPARARVMPLPKGVVGIISPWNYPVMLSLVPLAGALAAGNRVILKLSEHTPETSSLLGSLLSKAFEDTEVAPVQGGREVGSGVTRLALDHLLFTGGNTVGKQVAQAAADNLTPITLELGGKCPVIYNPSFSVDRFAERVVQGKCFSAGQSCVAPDYLLVPEGGEASVVSAITAAVTRRYPSMVRNPDYSGVASPSRLARLRFFVSDAVEKGAKRIDINPSNESFNGIQKMPLTLLMDVPQDAEVMREEIFGPVLPIVTYKNLDHVVAYINERPTPLALYCFDHDKRRLDRVLREIPAGGVTVNDTLMHFICDDLPRFALGMSGQGGYYGRQSFDTFTHYKSVFRQSRITGTSLFAPPYSPLTDRLLRWMIGR